MTSKKAALISDWRGNGWTSAFNTNLNHFKDPRPFKLHVYLIDSTVCLSNLYIADRNVKVSQHSFLCL